jgi:hypothetical protein
MPKDFMERRGDPRRIIDKYSSVELSIGEFCIGYQFRIWNMSKEGMCLLVKEDSDVLSFIKIGDILNMKYYGSESRKRGEYLKTKIEHITKSEEGRFMGHCLVGISIVENHDPDE